MWVLYAILPPLFVIGLIVAAVVAIIRARSGDGWSITFPGVLLAYVSVAMFVSVFLTAGGGALLLKAGLSGIAGRDFSYDNQREMRYIGGHWDPDEENEWREVEVDPSDDAIRNDVAAGVTLVFVGLALFAVHGAAAVALRRRHAPGERLIARAYNLFGLAASSIGFLASGGVAIHDLLRRYALETETIEHWDYPRPGGGLATAIVFLPLAVWFGWRIWQEFALESPPEELTAAR